ncbi:Endo/exonuclease/phosphatase domain-containing protein [Trichostrongylus colubriformis]|uniref:Endo/exonuclease/phosphatase domain-containing protein n=1 Tax=Trichostrongylus colubriformis TaxID=6319 RepID=A0AAN8FDW7_TRICO
MRVVICLLALTFRMGHCEATKIRVMTFNIWNSGSHVENGLRKIAKHILLVNPDIVGLQEVQRQDVLPKLLNWLGEPWTGVSSNDDYPDVAIVTKHDMITQSYTRTNRSISMKIQLHSGHVVSFWNVHLDYKAYGPYAANNKLVTNLDQILAGEKPLKREGRAQNMEEISQHPQMIQSLNKSDVVPVILAGDFNSPSHMDWTEETIRNHGNWKVEWPATKIAESMGLTDSFRELYPNVTEVAGCTWSTVNKYLQDWEFNIPEPQDRIDFIYYRGHVKPVSSYLYSGSEPLNPMPHHRYNDYPSDHFALITEFEFQPPSACTPCEQSSYKVGPLVPVPYTPRP